LPQICHTGADYRSYFRQNTRFPLNIPFIAHVMACI
jgi:hypothetical protein